MDDLLPGVIIEGVLGVDLKDCPGFKSQMDYRISADSQEMRTTAQVHVYAYTSSKTLGTLYELQLEDIVHVARL